MTAPVPLALAFAFLLAAGCSSSREERASTTDEDGWQCVFEVDPGDWSSSGRNEWFVLEPGYRLEFENEKKTVHLVISVLEETRRIDGVETRVVEEREEKNGKLEEVSRNYFAISKSANDVYYFGEDVDMYEDGKVSSHEGGWLSGANGARFGLMLPARAVLGAKWYQEHAPGVALDRCEVTSIDKTLVTPAGEFLGCLELTETTPLEPDAKDKKLFAPGVGLVKDGSLRLVRVQSASARSNSAR